LGVLFGIEGRGDPVKIPECFIMNDRLDGLEGKSMESLAGTGISGDRCLFRRLMKFDFEGLRRLGSKAVLGDFEGDLA